MTTTRTFGSSRGASATEMVISILSVILLVYGIIEFSRFLSIKSAASHFAHKASSFASVVPDLDNDYTLNQHGISLSQAAKQAVEAEAIKLLNEYSMKNGYRLDSNDPPTLYLPSTVGGVSLTDAMRTQNLKVKFTLYYRPLIPFPFLNNKPIVIESISRREFASPFSMPQVRSDCYGEEWQLDVEQGSANYTGHCNCVAQLSPHMGPCPAGSTSYWTASPTLPRAKVCGCRCDSDGKELKQNSSNPADQFCGCPAGTGRAGQQPAPTGNPSYFSCNCSNIAVPCGADQYRDPLTCQCKGCTGNFEEDPTRPYTCRCPPDNCPANKEPPYGSTTWQHEMPAPAPEGCRNPNPGAGACVCKASLHAAAPQFIDPTTCACNNVTTCPAAAHWSEYTCSCSCDTSGYVIGSNGQCGPPIE